MKPVNGQIIDDVSKLGSLLDIQGKNIKFEQDKNVDGDLVYIGKGSDGRTYSAQLAKKNLVISIFATPEEKVEKKAIEDRGAKLVQGFKVSGTVKDAEKLQEPVKEGSKDKKELDKIVEELDKPVLEKEDHFGSSSSSKNKNTSTKK